MNKKNIYITITVTITILLFMIMIFLPETSLRGFFYSSLDILFLLLLEAIVFYDITKTVKNPNKIINYINIIIFNIFVLLKIIDIIDLVDEFVTLIMISILILRIIATIISVVFKKIPVLKHNTKKIIVSIIITIISCTLIFTVIKNIIIIKIPYQIYSAITPLGGMSWFGESDQLKIINNIDELEEIYNEDNIDEDTKVYLSYSLKKSKKTLEDRLKEEKEKVIIELKINQQFFDDYYLIFVNEVTGNTATPMGIDYITYNKINNQIKFVQVDIIGNNVGGCVMSYSSYFVKIEKKYTGDISWETKYLPF